MENQGRVLNFLRIAPRTVRAADKETKQAFERGIDSGTIESPLAKVMLLGDRCVGKTSTVRLLLGREHVDEHISTHGIDNKHTETFRVTEDWAEINEEMMSGYERDEFKRAAAYYTVFEKNKRNIDRPRNKLPLMSIFLYIFALFGITQVCYWLVLQRKCQEGFAPILMLCSFILALIGGDKVNGFNIGNGASFVIVFINYWVQLGLVGPTTPPWKIVYYAVGCWIMGGFQGFLLALGIGAGLCMSLCLLVPSVEVDMVYNSESGIHFTIVIAAILLGFLLERNPFTKNQQFALPIVINCLIVLSPTLFLVRQGLSERGFFFLSGCLYGMAFIWGQEVGRTAASILEIGHTRRVETDIIGGLIGAPFGQVIGWNWKTPGLLRGFFSIVGFAFCVYMENVRHNKNSSNEIPVRLIAQMKKDKQKMWPTRLAILDCAGDEVYHSAHHLFMSKNSIFIIAFSMRDADLNVNSVLTRVLFWLNSVLCHARHEDAKVLLVATHKMAVADLIRRSQLMSSISDRLALSFQRRLVYNTSKKNYIFCIDNRDRGDNDEDLELMRLEVWNKAQQVKYATLLTVRVPWFAFNNFIRQRRDRTLNPDNALDVIVRFNYLWEKMKRPCRLKEPSEFHRMLTYFTDMGEIYYNADDPILCQYVVMDPDLLPKAIDRILRHEEQPIPEDLLLDHREFLSTGIASNRFLLALLGDDIGVDRQLLLHLLHALDVVIPLHQTVGSLTRFSDQYLVSFRLPHKQNIKQAINSPEEVFQLQFKQFYPEPLFLRLLSKCYQITRSTAKRAGFKLQKGQIQVFRNYGLFWFGSDLKYSLELGPHSVDKNYILIRIQHRRRNNTDPIPTTRARVFEFLRVLDSLVCSIRDRYFEFLEFSVAALCPCSREVFLRDGADSSALDFLCLVEHASSSESQSLPDTEITCNCNETDEEVVFNFGEPSTGTTCLSREIKSDLEFSDLAPVGAIKAFISCSRKDRMIVQEEIIPVFESASEVTLGVKKAVNISVLINAYDNPNPGLSYYEPLAVNLHLMQYCQTIVILLSRAYCEDSRCKRELQEAVKTYCTQGKPLFVIRLDNCQAPPELSIQPIVNYQEAREKGKLAEEFYIRLINAIHEQCSKLENEM